MYVVRESKPNTEGYGFASTMIVGEWGTFEEAELDRQRWLQSNPSLYYTVEVGEPYAHMMHPGEDTEEFCLRACREAQKVDKVRGDFLVQQLRQARNNVFHGQNTDAWYEQHLEQVTAAAIGITGPLEPSDEYVGYF